MRLLEIQIKENEDIVNARKITEDLKELLFYPSDIDTINTAAYPRLDSLITFFHKYPNWEILVVGYTDTDSTIAYNIDLSREEFLK